MTKPTPVPRPPRATLPTAALRWVAVPAALVLLLAVGVTGASADRLGEAGVAQFLDDDEWEDESFRAGFPSQPLVFATTQTDNGGQDPSAAHVRRVGAGGFETQHCEWDLSTDDCDSHAEEDNGWVAIDPAAIEAAEGMDAGTVQTTWGAAEDHIPISFDSDITSTPLVFAQVQTENGGGDPLNVQVISRDVNGATLEFCDQGSSDGCESHRSETIAWWAIDPTTVDDKPGFDFGTFDTDNDDWEAVVFDEVFREPPVVIALVQTENGPDEALYPEVRRVTPSSAEVRFCDAVNKDATSKAENECDDHAEEDLAWLAVEPGSFSQGPIAAPGVERNPDGSVTAFNDRDGDGDADGGEEIATAWPPEAGVTPACQGLDSVCWRAKVQASFLGHKIAFSTGAPYDAGVLPVITPPAPSGAPTSGADDDGDGLPGVLRFPRSRYHVNEDGTTGTTPTEPLTVRADPDDTDSATDETVTTPPVPVSAPLQSATVTQGHVTVSCSPHSEARTPGATWTGLLTGGLPGFGLQEPGILAEPRCGAQQALQETLGKGAPVPTREVLP